MASFDPGLAHELGQPGGGEVGAKRFLRSPVSGSSEQVEAYQGDDLRPSDGAAAKQVVVYGVDDLTPAYRAVKVVIIGNA